MLSAAKVTELVPINAPLVFAEPASRLRVQDPKLPWDEPMSATVGESLEARFVVKNMSPCSCTRCMPRLAKAMSALGR